MSDNFKHNAGAAAGASGQAGQAYVSAAEVGAQAASSNSQGKDVFAQARYLEQMFRSGVAADTASDGMPSEAAAMTLVPANTVFEAKSVASNGYSVYSHPVYGRYIDAREFGTDATGLVDSLPAIKKALAAAHQEKAALYLSGKIYISDQIVIDAKTSGVTGIFGDGMGKTVVSFDKAQTGIFNSNTNHDDIRSNAGILIDGQSGKTVAELSVKYTNPDFYRKGMSYFGKVNGILVNDADNTLISKVEVSGANRAGVFFTSTQALARDPEGKGKTFKARVQSGEVDENYANLPLGENNRIIDSHLHHNRVAGAMVGYQKNFVAEGNLLAWNGHKADGGTGYGITAMSGSYNYGVTFRGNTTDHNYRKGLDVHDGTGIVIENNIVNGDRLNGIAVYNRQFSLDNVKIKDNTVIQDAKFRVSKDDETQYLNTYHGYTGIQIQTNTQFQNLHTKDGGYFEISGNHIQGLKVFKDAVHNYGIEFRNHERTMDYTLDISGNRIEGESTKYLVAVINSTKNTATGALGPGSGQINIVGNTADIKTVGTGMAPIYIEEKNAVSTARGGIHIENNSIKVTKASDGYTEGVHIQSNARHIEIEGNTLELHGKVNKAVFSVTGQNAQQQTLTVENNDLLTDNAAVGKNWLYSGKIQTDAQDNTHNGSKIADVSTAAKPSAGFTPSDEQAAEWAEKLDLGGVKFVEPGHSTQGLEAKAGAGLARLAAERGEDGTSAQEDDWLPKAGLDFAALLGADKGGSFALPDTPHDLHYSVEKVDDNWQTEALGQLV